MNKVSGTKWQVLADKVVEIYNDCGVKILGKYDDYGLNQYRKSENVIFKFYWDSIDMINTPDGGISFGSKSGMGQSFPLSQKALVDYFGLELVDIVNGFTGERWFIYSPTKNIPQ